MPGTYEKIVNTTLQSSQSSVTFSSITNSYTDLIVVVSGSLASGGTGGLVIRCNNDSASNYSATQMDSSNGTSSSYKDNNITEMNLGIMSGSNESGSIFHFNNYSSTTIWKSVISRGNNPASYIRTAIGVWRNTAAINRLDFFNPSVNIAAGTKFTIYGIKAA